MPPRQPNDWACVIRLTRTQSAIRPPQVTVTFVPIPLFGANNFEDRLQLLLSFSELLLLSHLQPLSHILAAHLNHLLPAYTDPFAIHLSHFVLLLSHLQPLSHILAVHLNHLLPAYADPFAIHLSHFVLLLSHTTMSVRPLSYSELLLLSHFELLFKRFLPISTPDTLSHFEELDIPEEQKNRPRRSLPNCFLAPAAIRHCGQLRLCFFPPDSRPGLPDHHSVKHFSSFRCILLHRTALAHC